MAVQAPRAVRGGRGGLLDQVWGLIRAHPLVLGLVAVWSFAPLVLEFIHVARHGGMLLGTNGADYFDQFQYLAWIRDAGSHGLASNLWVTGPTPHDYLQPMYIISGVLWRLGLSLQVAYLVWKPVAVLVLFLGCAAYARHHLPDDRRRQAAVIVLAIFYQTPVLAIGHWTGHLSDLHRYQLILATDDGYSALQLWGFEHTALAIGLMAVFALALERLIAGHHPWGLRTSVATGVAAVSGGLVSWLHPWQGVTLLIIVGGMFVVRPPRRRYLTPPVLAAVIAIGLPLLYGFALSHADASWSAFEAQTLGTSTAPWWALLAAFGPLVIPAAFALRRPASDRDAILLLWLVGVGAVYFLVPQFPPHALAGLTVPLAVLAVDGWGRMCHRLRVSLRPAVALGVVAILALTVPAAVLHGQGVADDLKPGLTGSFSQAQLRLTDAQARAVHYLDTNPRPGAVLAPWFLSLPVPGYTGRQVFVGHLQWEPHGNLPLDQAFFGHQAGAAMARLRRAILVRSAAVFVLADCHGPPTLTADLSPIARPVARYGCVTVYERFASSA